ncbi:ATP-dependent helicase HepA [Nitrosomonas sp. PY1]|uniref:RNA polymerase-associated protein RapA n=1 Tax=Nitrosomonas sp. PY1 TaxID=1803906 RepID=UPI001FC86C2F|nr:RNA polymerase-associated protein RapA [Nitrosomonas sp. PY1]GKS70315.1 ATP-dependent helicase HepA [Nitrosomonas sp. PY1]
MRDFKTGQRWICDVDLSLGLGTIQTVYPRVINIIFNATGEVRSYAKDSAPLTRVIFRVNDMISSQDGVTLKVLHVVEQNGLVLYSGITAADQKIELPEADLAHQVHLNRPMDRLMLGQLGQNKWFQVRYQTLLMRHRFAQMPLYGLIGTRTSLIPHQLYIAHEVAQRYAPRVLLADEVGLGKTIEAGLILHQQLLTERVKRVLVIVPETLIHQWLVEMLRRFNLRFSIFDEPRYQSMQQSAPEDNPFHAEQLVLCSLDFLRNNDSSFQSALAGNWDLLIVDEAHHLQWSEHSVSQEYRMIEALSARTSGVLLLTATPEQLGKVAHFARLRLLDPDRFTTLSDFIIEEQRYEPIAEAIENLLNDKALTPSNERIIAKTLGSAESTKLLTQLIRKKVTDGQIRQIKKSLADQLLDRHGTGRILFRNNRATIKGFPGRKLFPAPLPLPEQYHQCLQDPTEPYASKPHLLLNPELLYQSRSEPGNIDWTAIDPRISWLQDLLKKLKTEKILIITASAQTALDIAKALKILTGRHAPIFHESLSLIERDRAAALFANNDDGSQVLICSEIGSEGRNFQFARHLVLFDLPLNPDLLEQRIGRLDRIGQSSTIHIHVPYLENSGLAVMFHWYHEGLNAFEKTCPIGQTVFKQIEAELTAILHQAPTNLDKLPNLLSVTRSISETVNNQLRRGRDKLLEYHSFRSEAANELLQLAFSQENDSSLSHYMEEVFDCCGVHIEEHRSGSFHIEPSEHMTIPFPGLDDEGAIITYSRSVALANEDMHFLTWEHPMVLHALDRITGSESGNAVVTSIQHKNLSPGTLLLECLFIVQPHYTGFQQINHYLPPTLVRTLVDEGNNNYQAQFSHESINPMLVPVAINIAKQVIQLKENSILNLFTLSEERANKQIPKIISQSHERIKQLVLPEIKRLSALKQINPSVRDEEIDFFDQLLKQATIAINSAQLRLDAIRVIVAI